MNFAKGKKNHIGKSSFLSPLKILAVILKVHKLGVYHQLYRKPATDYIVESIKSVKYYI